MTEAPDHFEIAVAFFDGACVSAMVDAPGPDALDANERAALEAFQSLTPADRRAATHHLRAYARDTWISRGSWRALWLGNVWAQVSPGPVFLIERDGALFVAMEAECAREPEHGLMLVWRDGHTLCKIGPFDGHATNAGAYDDAAMLGVVYKSRTGRFDTRA